MDALIVKKHLERLNVWDLFSYRPEVKALRSILSNTENILEASSGTWSGKRWMIVLADRRLVIIHTNPVSGAKSMEWEVDVLKGCIGNKGVIFGSLEITLETQAGTEKMLFRNVPKRTVESFHRAMAAVI